MPAVTEAQGAARPARIRGVVVDSLLGSYLAGAQVALFPGGRTVITDSTGRFAFDSVAAGEWHLAFRHLALDALRVVPPTLTVRAFGGATASVVLATPSFERLRAPICQGSPDSLSETLAYGRVQTADGTRLKVDVGVSWLSASDAARAGTVRTLADDLGQSWSACGIPWGAWFHAFVRDSAHTASAYRRMGDRGIVVQDLLIATGVRRVHGLVVDDAGQPVPQARVSVVGTAAVAMTDAAGRFAIPDAPASTITLDARAAGFAPLLVATTDTSWVVLRMPPLHAAVEEDAHGSDYLRLIERSGRRGIAVLAGSSLLTEASLVELLPSATCRYWLDGRPVAREFLLAQPKRLWRAVELYVAGADAPPEYRHDGCPVVLLWTAASDW